MPPCPLTYKVHICGAHRLSVPITQLELELHTVLDVSHEALSGLIH